MRENQLGILTRKRDRLKMWDFSPEEVDKEYLATMAEKNSLKEKLLLIFWVVVLFGWVFVFVFPVFVFPIEDQKEIVQYAVFGFLFAFTSFGVSRQIANRVQKSSEKEIADLNDIWMMVMEKMRKATVHEELKLIERVVELEQRVKD